MAERITIQALNERLFAELRGHTLSVCPSDGNERMDTMELLVMGRNHEGERIAAVMRVTAIEVME